MALRRVALQLRIVLRSRKTSKNKGEQSDVTSRTRNKTTFKCLFKVALIFARSFERRAEFHARSTHACAKARNLDATAAVRLARDLTVRVA
eukprot:6133746-Amphidinium_carterae.1